MLNTFFTKYLKRAFVTLPIPISFWSAWACIGGISIASYTHVNLFILVCIVTVTSSASIILIRANRKALIPILMSCFVLGYYRYNTHVGHFQKSALFFQDPEKQPLAGKATIVAQEYLPSKRHATCLTITLTSLKGHTVPSRSSIKLYLHAKASLLPGDEISFRKLIFKKQKNRSYEQYLFKEGIVGCIYAERLVYKRIHRPWFTLKRWCSQKREELKKRISQNLSPRTASLFSTLFLGGKATKHHLDLRISFSCWGIVHYLARSGLHVMVLIGTWSFLLSFIRIPWILVQILLFLLLGIYYLLSWPSVSFIRACIAWLCYQGFTLTGKSTRALHIISLTTLIVLLSNPYQLFFLDFQLSFGLTCALAWWQEAYYQHKIQKN